MNKLIIFLIFSTICLADQDLFNFNFYQELATNNNDKNMFFSSYSLEVALSMLSEGCVGPSAQQIFSVCSLPSDANTRQQEMEQQIAQINSNNTNFVLKTANALWPSSNPDFVLETNFENVIKVVYQGMVEALDFEDAPDQATDTINTWVAEETNNKIQNLIPQGVISDLTRLVITNCIYFKAVWEYQFNPYETYQTDFYLENSETTQVQMMNQLTEKQFKYYEDNLVQIVRMPYKGDSISMMVLLPKQGMASLEQNLSEEQFQNWIDQLQLANVDLYLPKFKMEWAESLIEPLENMGITTVFGPNADLSGIDGLRDLIVTKILQKAIIEVDEYGTEAAAQKIDLLKINFSATTMIFDTTSMPDNVQTFKANKPFIFMIMEEQTQTVLFMGKLAHPELEENDYQMTFNNGDMLVDKRFLA